MSSVHTLCGGVDLQELYREYTDQTHRHDAERSAQCRQHETSHVHSLHDSSTSHTSAAAAAAAAADGDDGDDGDDVDGDECVDVGGGGDAAKEQMSRMVCIYPVLISLCCIR